MYCDWPLKATTNYNNDKLRQTEKEKKAAGRRLKDDWKVGGFCANLCAKKNTDGTEI